MNNNNLKQLGSAEMKEIKGGTLPPPKPKWKCLVDGTYYDVCYSVQPQTPCNYSSPCEEMGNCDSSADEDLCVY